MKKLFTILLVSYCLSLYSQTEKKTSFGFKAGYNNSIINGVDMNGDESGYLGIEIYAGFFADTKLNEKWNLEFEILYSYTEDYNFIEIPLHLKRNVSNKWNVFIGPKLDFIADNDNDVFETDNEFKNFGISLDFGIQYNFSKRFFAETRYSISFTEQITDFPLDINKGKRNTFRIGLGFKF